MNTFDIFLIPTTSQYKEYNKIINSLSEKYKTPSFPHVTLFERIEADEKTLITKVENIIKDLDRVEVEIFGMNFTNTINQSVFAQIKMSPKLLTLYNELGMALDSSDTSPFFPHMSFIYGDLLPEEKSDIATQIKLDTKLVLDKLSIYMDGPLISDWKKIIEFELK